MLLFNRIVNNWFEISLNGIKLQEMLGYLVTLDISKFETIFKDQVMYMFSYFDVPNDEEKTAEYFYHAFTLGLVLYLKDNYYIHSNRESGMGRYDMELEAKDKTMPSFIFEFKLKKDMEVETRIDEGEKQIKKKKYTSNLEERGITNIHKLVFVCDKKEVTVREIA